MIMEHTATYSPEDNKIRITPGYRLDAEEYARVKAAGYIWAPKQELFVAPMWTPAREDLALEMCGEIGDEDTSLVDRAAERAERFADYSDKRAEDAERAHNAVSAITDNIPMGQPILVGHHSEKHARKDAERIENGMRKAVNMWETSKYWKMRAAGALHHAKYKERPDVRARRIKGLESDLRKQNKEKEQAEKFIKAWNTPDLTMDIATHIANYDHVSKCFSLSEYPREAPACQYEGSMSLWSALDGGVVTPEQARDIAVRVHERGNVWRVRWINHINNRLEYEKAMLDEQGKSDLLKPKPRLEQLPLCNYRAPDGFLMIENQYRKGEMIKYRQVDMTKAEYAKIYTDYKGTRIIENSHRVRIAIRVHEWLTVFITDSKEHAKPEPIEKAPVRTEPRFCDGPVYQAPEPTKFDEMRDTLKEGVKVVVAPQLFPTPTEIAEMMVDYAEIETGQRILEPSAGTGNLIKAIEATETRTDIIAVELNYNLVQLLKNGNGNQWGIDEVVQGDFLDQNGNLGTFDRVLMNPPFENGVDIKHINHALAFLRPGGRLVALCANGPRQQAAFKERADRWEVLPEGSFKSQGTGVNVALMVITA
jgi:phospholipid N-methyltransferase